MMRGALTDDERREHLEAVGAQARGLREGERQLDHVSPALLPRHERPPELERPRSRRVLQR
jgi:hypothetical protein